MLTLEICCADVITCTTKIKMHQAGRQAEMSMVHFVSTLPVADLLRTVDMWNVFVRLLLLLPPPAHSHDESTAEARHYGCNQKR